jgi:alpha-D-xyloside xylohydrolase
VPVSIEYIPVFVKAGSIVPSGPVKQYAAEESDDPMTLSIYPGADAEFRLYEDDGNNPESSTIDITWNDSQRKLIICKRRGSFEGMKEERIFKATVAGQEKTIRYDGSKITIRF